MITEFLIASKRLVESVEFDVNGTQGKGGHGGLTSDKTLRAAGELRILIDRAERATADLAVSALEAAEKTDYFAEAITVAFGERCPDFAWGCHCCEAWLQYDAYMASAPRSKETGE